ncbi:cyclase family protein [Candidatus Nitrospira inopinata]|uniref:cyclase family protein n=1 Tax=Candidatus Nitrospira inopinata TaxID=1715989 RepID=UPI000B1C6B48|nr:cyclase family protein [Candidatus Nitrospira inopinata]
MRQRQTARSYRRETAGAWIDVTVPLRNGMVRWPGNPPVRVRRVLDMNKGDECTVTSISLGVHSGTHMDAPQHFLRTGLGIDAMPVDAGVGRARVVAVNNPAFITVEELRRHRVRRGERLLFKTCNSSRCWKTNRFLKDFVSLDEEAAHWLVDQGVRTVGIDYLSVAGYKSDTAAIHTILLKGGVWIIEGLNLSGVRPGVYDMLCLPLKIAGGDGAPARALLKPVSKPVRSRGTRKT